MIKSNTAVEENLGKTQLTFVKKEPVECPICQYQILKEELRSGGGRLITAELTVELHRRYEVTKRYGAVYPLLYNIVVCPQCYFAAFLYDFEEIAQHQTCVLKIKDAYGERKELITEFLAEETEDVKFDEPKTLISGLLAYYLAIFNYDYFPHILSPVIKQGICALRCAWIGRYLHNEYLDGNYWYLAKMFYRKALFFYMLTLEYEEQGIESIAACRNLGPDIDKNYGYNGILYIAAYLEYYFGVVTDQNERVKNLERVKNYLGRVFGHGKISRNKPGFLLDQIKDLYSIILQDLKKNTSIV